MSHKNSDINTPQEDFEAIDSYLSGEMDVSRTRDFEDRLQIDPALRSKVEEYKIYFKGVEEGSLKVKLDDFHQEIMTAYKPQERNSGKEIFLPSSFLKYAAAVAILLLVAVGSWWVLNGPNQHERLFAQYFMPDPGLATVMSSDSDYDFYVAMVDYKRGEYEKAISKWEQLQDERPDSDTLSYFLGVAYLASGQEAKAIPFLEEVIQKGESAFLNEAYYYVGLSHLKMGHVEQAKTAFEKSTLEKSQMILSELKD